MTLNGLFNFLLLDTDIALGYGGGGMLKKLLDKGDIISTTQRKEVFPMSLLYFFIAIWVSVNGISSPFDDVLSFFMWAAVLVPVIACIFILLNCGDDDRKN